MQHQRPRAPTSVQTRPCPALRKPRSLPAARSQPFLDKAAKRLRKGLLFSVAQSDPAPARVAVRTDRIQQGRLTDALQRHPAVTRKLPLAFRVAVKAQPDLLARTAPRPWAPAAAEAARTRAGAAEKPAPRRLEYIQEPDNRRQSTEGPRDDTARALTPARPETENSASETAADIRAVTRS